MIPTPLKAIICLHNYLRLTENAHYLPSGFVNCEREIGEIVPVDWRKIVLNDDVQGLQHLWHVSGNRHCFSADQTAGQVPLQTQHVQENTRIM